VEEEEEKLTDDEEQASAEAAAAEEETTFEVGQIVRVYKLENAKELNGSKGRVLSIELDSRRAPRGSFYVVSILGPRTPCAMPTSHELGRGGGRGGGGVCMGGDGGGRVIKVPAEKLISEARLLDMKEARARQVAAARDLPPSLNTPSRASLKTKGTPSNKQTERGGGGHGGQRAGIDGWSGWGQGAPGSSMYENPDIVEEYLKGWRTDPLAVGPDARVADYVFSMMRRHATILEEEEEEEEEEGEEGEEEGKNERWMRQILQRVYNPKH
jgi:hypothetical protein